MARIAVVLPGIMGSVLYYQKEGPQSEIWGENFKDNYRRLIQNPGVLTWTRQTASAKVLKTARLTDWLPFLKVELWKKSLELLSSWSDFRLGTHLVEFGYDWRASLIDTAKLLSEKLSLRVNAPVDSLWTTSCPQFTFLTHSMGGLVIRIAIGLKLINPTWVDRIIHIGTPLKGAAVAFRAGYDRSTLPLLREILGLVHMKNEALFRQNLLTCFKSFPSLYQLMPPREVKYLYYSPSLIKNPLDETFLPPFGRMHTEEAHKLLIEAERIIITHKMKVFTVYTAVNVNTDTELMYRVSSIDSPDRGYLIHEVIGHTDEGDGTVPAQSASGSEPGAVGKSVLNVDHAYLCNDKSVVEVLSTILS